MSEIFLLTYFYWQWIKLFWSCASSSQKRLEAYYNFVLCARQQCSFFPLKVVQPNIEYLIKGQTNFSFGQMYHEAVVNKQKAFTAVILMLSALQQSIFTLAFLFYLIIIQHVEHREGNINTILWSRTGSIQVY